MTKLICWCGCLDLLGTADCCLMASGELLYNNELCPKPSNDSQLTSVLLPLFSIGTTTPLHYNAKHDYFRTDIVVNNKHLVNII